MQRRDVAKACWVWSIMNQRAEWLARELGSRSMRLRYEDFAAHPRATVRQILSLLSANGGGPEFPDDRRVRVGTNHTVSGNPGRFEYEELVQIVPDSEWKTRMKREDVSYATRATSELLGRYGYLDSNERRETAAPACYSVGNPSDSGRN